MRDASARHPPPVASAPSEALAAASERLAKGWLVELVARAPLSAAAQLPIAELAREAPDLFAAAARALSSDDALARLAPGGDLAPLAGRLGRLAGTSDASATALAADALRGVLWAAALDELDRPAASTIADLADRLGHVCAVVTATALEGGVAHDAAGAAAEPAPEASDGERVPGTDPVADLAAELERVAPGEPRPQVVVTGATANAHRIVRPPRAADVPPPDAQPRAVDGDPRSHIAARAAEFVADGRPFAVLLVELDGIDRLLGAQTGQEVVRAVEAAEQALEDLLRPGDGIRRERLGRLWLTLPGAGPAGARALALRAAGAVERAAGHRGAPLTASVGVAVCPRDGTDPDALAEQAEDGLLAAQASGVGGDAPAAT